MAVELTATDYSGTGTGAAATYGTGIYANASDQIKVYIDGALQTIGDDYSLSGIGSAGGVDVLGAFTLGSAVYVERVTPITQLVDTQNNETILEDVLDAAFDKLTLIAQEIGGKAGRALLFPKGEAGYTLPAPAARASKFIYFDALGNPLLSAGSGVSDGLRADLAAPTGSSLVGFQQSGTGAVARTVQDKLRDVVSVADFGASPSASAATNNTAFQNALNDGRALFIPSGTYNLTAKLTSTNKAVAIYTAAGVTLKWLTTATTQGLDFTFSNITSQTLFIGDIALLTEKEGGGTALKAAWPVSGTGYARLMELGRIRISGADIPGQVGYWDFGIDATNAWLSYCETLDFYGKASGATALSTAAVAVRGTTTDSKFPIRARYAKAGVLINGFAELLDISGSIFVACDYGVDCSGTAGLNAPGFNWIGGHAACFKGAIRSVNILQGNVSDLLIYKRTDSAQNFIAFGLDSASSDWQISDCKVYSLGNPGGGTCTAVSDAGVNNTTRDLFNVACTTDLVLVAGASGFNHSFARSDNARGVITQGSINGTVRVGVGGAPGSSISYFDLLAANSTTPTILGHRKWAAGTGHLLTANSGATTITNFPGAFPGDEIVVQANDANTTIQHNAGMLLNGGVNKTLANGETIRLRRVNSTTWKQV